MSAFGWSLPAGCHTLPGEDEDIPSFCEDCENEELMETCCCNPKNCEAFAIHLHLRSCIKHHDICGDGMSCEGCVAESEARLYGEIEEYEKRLKAAGIP